MFLPLKSFLQITAAVMAVAVGHVASASPVSLNSLGTYTQNFTGFTAFNAAAEPPGWVTTFDSVAYRGVTSDGSSVVIAGSSGGGITSGGLFSWGATSGDPLAVGEAAIGWQGTGTTANIVTTASFLNNTGATITELTVSFDAYQWRQGAGGTLGGRNSTLDLSSSLPGVNAFNFTAAPPGVGNAAVGRAFGATAPAAFTADASFSQSLTGLNIANGDTFDFVFTYNRGTVGGGSAQGIAIDNFQITAVPEPSTLAMGGAAALAILRGIRRRFRKSA